MTDTRQATFIENIVSIYRSLEVTFSPRMHQIASVRRSLSQSPLPSHSQTRLKQHGQADFMDFDQLNRLSQGSPPVGVNSSDLGSGEDVRTPKRSSLTLLLNAVVLFHICGNGESLKSCI